MRSLGCTDADLAADIAQTAFVGAYPIWDTIRYPKAWLRKVARREYARRCQAGNRELPFDQASAETAVGTADTFSALIATQDLRGWLTSLWPVLCQTCGEPLGVKADISADGIPGGSDVLVSLHHSACRPSGTTRQHGGRLRQPTTSHVIGCLGKPGAMPHRTDIPALVMNPSCEQLQLTRDHGGPWRNATLDEFASVGMAAADAGFPPTIRQVRAELTGTKLTVQFPSDNPDRYICTTEPPARVLGQLNRVGSLAIAVTTSVLPTLMTPDDLPTALTDPGALVGWVPITKVGRTGRSLAGRFRP